MADDKYALAYKAVTELAASDALVAGDLFPTFDASTGVPTKATGTQLMTLVTSTANSYSVAQTFTGIVYPVESISAATEAVSAAESGKMFVDVRGSATTTFTLPAAAAGLQYTFVCGDAAGEILITPATGDAIVCKTDASDTGTGVAPAAGTGIKNTAATNVKGDFITLRALDGTTWYAVAQAGVWASQ